MKSFFLSVLVVLVVGCGSEYQPPPSVEVEPVQNIKSPNASGCDATVEEFQAFMEGCNTPVEGLTASEVQNICVCTFDALVESYTCEQLQVLEYDQMMDIVEYCYDRHTP